MPASAASTRRALGEGPDGYVIDRPMSPRAAIEPLALAYAFEASEDGATLRFRPRGGEPVADVDRGRSGAAGRRRAAAAHARAGNRIAARGLDRLHGRRDRLPPLGRRPRAASSAARRAPRMRTLSVVTNDAAAERRAEIWLQDLWAGRETAEFALPPSALALTPGDVDHARCRRARAACSSCARRSIPSSGACARARSMPMCSRCRRRRRADRRR